MIICLLYYERKNRLKGLIIALKSHYTLMKIIFTEIKLIESEP